MQQVQAAANGDDLLTSLSFGRLAAGDGSATDAPDPDFRLRYDGNIMGKHSIRMSVDGGALSFNGRAEVLAGYPWYGQIGRQTLVALPGIALEQGRTEDCLDVLDTVVRGRGTVCLRVLSRLPRLRMLRFGFSGCFSSCSGRWVRRRYGSATVS